MQDAIVGYVLGCLANCLAQTRLIKIEAIIHPAGPSFDSFEVWLASGRRLRVQVSFLEEEEPS